LLGLDYTIFWRELAEIRPSVAKGWSDTKLLSQLYEKASYREEDGEEDGGKALVSWLRNWIEFRLEEGSDEEATRLDMLRVTNVQL